MTCCGEVVVAEAPGMGWFATVHDDAVPDRPVFESTLERAVHALAESVDRWPDAMSRAGHDTEAMRCWASCVDRDGSVLSYIQGVTE